MALPARSHHLRPRLARNRRPNRRRLAYADTRGDVYPRDRTRLAGVHPDLVRVVERARTYAAFIVTEGLRTEARQRELFAKG